METSRFLARLIGPFFAVCGIALIFNVDAFRAIGAEIVKSPGLVYLAGLLALATGLAIVNTHNQWTADWRVVITLLGWLCVVGGVLRLVFPQPMTAFGASVLAAASDAWIIGEGIVIFALGMWLSYVGYLEKPWSGVNTAKARRRRGS